MGLFSGDTKINVYSSTYSMMVSNPDALKSSILLAVLSNGSVANSILNNSLNGTAARIDRMRTYAKNEYTLGLSTGYHSDTIVMDDADLAVIIAGDIEAIYGVLVDFNYITPLALYHIVVPYLLSVRGWNPILNTISVYPPDLTFLDNETDIHNVLVEGIALSEDQASIEITYRIDLYKISYVYVWEPVTVLDSSSTLVESYPIPEGFQLGKNYCIAAYRLLDDESNPEDTQNWWFYAIDSQKYPTINTEESLNEENNSLPVIPLRYNNQDLTAEAYQETELYLTSKKLLKKININIDTIGANLNSNASIGDIDHAYIMFGADLQSDNNEINRYLTEFFDHLADISAVSMYDHLGCVFGNSAFQQNTYAFNGQIAAPEPDTTTYSWEGHDHQTISATIVNNTSVSTLVEYGLDVSIVYSYCKSVTLAGSIGPIGTATKEITKGTSSTVNVFDGSNILGRKVLVDNSIIVFKHQIAENAYKQVTVKGLVHTNNIYPGRAVVTTLTEVFDNEDEHNFIIPIHYGISKKLPVNQRQILYEESFMLVLNSVVFTELAWYESGLFQAIIILGGICLALYTQQPWLLQLSAASNIGFVAVWQLIWPAILTSIAVTTAINLIAQVVGPEALAILGIIIAVVAITYGPNSSFNLLGKSLPTAKSFLSLSSALLSGAQREYGRLIGEVAEEYDAFKQEAKVKSDKLEAALELLEGPSDLALGLIDSQTRAFRFHPESGDPQKFYNMTIHTGNIGTLALDVIPNFHNIMLKLPEANNMASRNMMGIV